MATLLERIKKWRGRYYGDGLNKPATKEELERVAAIAQAVEELREVKPYGVAGIMRRADELLEGK